MKNYSFRKKIFFSMLLAAAVPMLTGYLVMLQVFNFTYRNNLNQEAETILSVTAGALDSAFSHIYEAVGQLGRNEAVRNNLKTGAGTDAKVYRELYAVSSEYGDYAAFSIYDAWGQKVTSVVNNVYIRDELPLDWGLLYEAFGKPGECVVRNARIYQGEKRIEYLRVGTTVCDETGAIIGYVVATVQNHNFDNMLKGINGESQGEIYAMDDFHEMVYCSADSYDEAKFRLIRKKLLEQEKNDEQMACLSVDNKYFYYMHYGENCGLYLFYRQPIAVLSKMKNRIITIAILSGLLGLAICVSLSGYLSSLVYRPIKRMQAAMSEIRKGNFQAKIQVETQDELGQLSDSFNLMSEHLTENMNFLVLRERELSEAHIKMMQAQLNPHFLYNTLDTMKWLGKVNEVPEVATLATGLAKILRMSISARTKIRLSEEMELVDAYMEIQKIRFEDRYEFIMDVPEELLDCAVPKLILQPIVENSIKHGFAGRETGTVMVQAFEVEGEKERELRMIVQDDGVGMPPERVEWLNTQSREENLIYENKSGEQSEKKNIGYFNVNAIIRLNYGDAYGLRAESEQGVGTKIYITMPIRKGENECIR